MKRIFSITLLCSLLLLVGCNKEKLTKATQTGANTMSCKINGVVHVAQSSWDDPAVYASVEMDYTLRVGGRMTINNKFTYNVNLYISKLTGVGTYYLDEVDNNGSLSTNGITEYSSKISRKGNISVTYLNYEKGVISGKFEFVAINEDNPSDSLSVTDGRFDIKM